jgi:hypothetical protein
LFRQWPKQEHAQTKGAARSGDCPQRTGMCAGGESAMDG